MKRLVSLQNLNLKVKGMNLKKIRTYLAIFLMVALVLFRFVYYPWQLNWGATEEEIKRNMVGDEIVKNPTFNATRAVTINASPENIWPWLVDFDKLKGSHLMW